LELRASDAATVTRARRAVIDHAHAMGLPDDVQERIAVAITEACANCVLHAYDGTAAQSTYRVDSRMDGDDLVIVVEDSGAGIAGDGDTREASKNAGLGWGLQLIRTVTSSVEIASELDRGTRIEMRFTVVRHTL
jgi:anti-sigma regulatory factor (Ser/Thr protein kinase)